MFAVFCAKLFAIYVVVHAVLVLAIYAIDIGCKWAIVGRRQPGLYAWEHSSYCMRWNLYLTTAVLRQHMLGYLQGSAYLVMYFRAHGAQIGRDVCLYPTGSDPMMTEPDLVSIGDNACINYAFLICHTNSKGVFSLNRLVVGEGATMRSWSRIMAGGVVGTDARMLEHTLGLVGDRVDDGIVWQGWPARDMITTAEYWRRRRHQIQLQLSHGQTKKYLVGGTAGHGEALGEKMRTMEAQLAQLAHENSKLAHENASMRAKLAAVAEHAGTSPEGTRTVQPQRPDGAQLIPAKVGRISERSLDIEANREVIATLPPLPRQVSLQLLPHSPREHMRRQSRTHSRLYRPELKSSESLDLLTASSATPPACSPRPMTSPRLLAASLVSPRPLLASRSASRQGARLLNAGQPETARQHDQVTIAITDRPAPPIKASLQAE